MQFAGAEARYFSYILIFFLISIFLTVPMKNQMDSQQSLPPGLTIIENFVTPDEEELLINSIEWTQQCNEQQQLQQVNAILKHRQVKHFGYEFRYDVNNVDVDKPLTEEPIPNECDFLWDRLRGKHSHFHEMTPPHQLTVNKYEPGQGSATQHS